MQLAATARSFYGRARCLPAHIYFDIFYDSLFGGLATPPSKLKLVSFVDFMRLNVNKVMAREGTRRKQEGGEREREAE